MTDRNDFARPPRRAADWPTFAPHKASARNVLRAVLTTLAALGTLLAATAAATFVLWAGGVGSARAQSTDVRDTSRTLSPYFVVENGEPGVEALPLRRTRADVAISGVIADVRVTQVYRNEGSVPIDARYVFPASTRAAVHALRLRVGTRAVDAEIREKRQARAEFAQAKREGKSAALLEQQRPNVFTMAIANVMPGDEIAVELRYTETIVPTEGTYRFVFPTVVGPRYNGGTDEAGQPTEGQKLEGRIAQPILRKGVAAKHTFELNARIVSPLPITAIASPSHDLRIDGIGAREAKLALPAASAHASRDVVIDYRLAGAAIDAGLLIQRGKTQADENFFLLMAEPPARVASADVLPRDYVFIIDVSGSMHGFPLDVAKALLRDLIGRLRPSDTFNVIPFAGGSSQLAVQSLPASEENIARAVRFINGQTGGGGTELLPALRRALALPTDHGRARTFIVVTDGYVTIEKEAFDLVRGRAGQANLFAFGIGSSVNRFLIEGLARAGKGEPFFVLNPQQAEVEAVRFRKMIEQPVLTRLRVKFPEGSDGTFEAYDLDTPQQPDLFAQRALILMGKFRGELKGAIEIEGLAAGGAVRLPIDVAQAVQAGALQGTPSDGLKYLWARSRIAQLGDYTKLGADDALVREITALGLKYNLLTDYTSFIAIDKVVRAPGGNAQGVDQPSPLPDGVSELAVASAPATPEPEFALLAALAGGLTWWMRRRRTASQPAQARHV
ncbi:MAG: VIT domain-containing protein [Burkholderiaceae bacterium]|nr:VIT domain-containing protein [Burkholderiaceae bacterium]